MAGIPPIKTTLGLVIRENHKTVQARLKRAMQLEVNRVFQKAAVHVETALQTKVANWIFYSDEMQSLLGGVLRGHFGIISPAPQVMTIVASIADTIEVNWTPVNPALMGSPLVIKVQPSDLLNVLGAITPLITENGYSLDWIEWLLLRGDSPVVFDYHVVEGDFGRTGDAKMVSGGNYSVGRAAPTYTGTQDNNFITRALEGKESEIQRLIVTSVERAM